MLRRGALFLWFDEQIHAANRWRFYAICSNRLHHRSIMFSAEPGLFIFNNKEFALGRTIRNPTDLFGDQQ
jgi:hypothetical protein